MANFNELGDLFITPFAQEQIPKDELIAGLERHVRRDWGPYGGADEVLPSSGCPSGTLLISQQIYHPPIPEIVKKSGIKERIVEESDFSIMTHNGELRRRTIVLLPNVDIGDITLLPFVLDQEEMGKKWTLSDYLISKIN